MRVGTGVLVIDLANGTTVESIGIAAKPRGLDAQIANGTPGSSDGKSGVPMLETGDSRRLSPR